MDMTDLEILPIFNQSAPGIWDEFLRIRIAAMRENYNYKMNAGDCNVAMQEYVYGWGRRSYNFAFGAYAGPEMVGFVQGDCVGNVATIRGLFVKPQFQGRGVGAALLRRGEMAAAFGAKSLDLVAYAGAMKFYVHVGYTPLQGVSNHFVKKIRVAQFGVIPVFKATGDISRACGQISGVRGASFNASVVNAGHNPMFVYMDANSRIQGYAVKTEDVSGNENLELHIAPNQSTQFIRGRLTREFDKLAACRACVVARKQK